MITKEQYEEAQITIDLYEEQQLEKGAIIAKYAQADIIEYTEDKAWYVYPEINWEGDLIYKVSNDTYDEDYSGQYDKFIKNTLGDKYKINIFVTGIYGK